MCAAASDHAAGTRSTPTADATCRSCATASARRATTVTVVAPSRAAAARAARAVPPAPSTVTAAPGRTPAADSTSTMPVTSVLSAYHEPSGRRTNVLAAPTAAATGDVSSATASAASLPGMVTDSPAHSGPRPATSAGSSCAPHSIRVYDQPSSPAAA